MLQSSGCFWRYPGPAWGSLVNSWPRMREIVGGSCWACATQRNKLFTLGVHLWLLSPHSCLGPCPHPFQGISTCSLLQKRHLSCICLGCQATHFCPLANPCKRSNHLISHCLWKTLLLVQIENAKPKIGGGLQGPSSMVTGFALRQDWTPHISDALCSALLHFPSSSSFLALGLLEVGFHLWSLTSDFLLALFSQFLVALAPSLTFDFLELTSEFTPLHPHPPPPSLHPLLSEEVSGLMVISAECWPGVLGICCFYRRTFQGVTHPSHWRRYSKNKVLCWKRL